MPSILREFENLYPLVHKRLFSRLMAFDIPQASALFGAPFGRHPVKEVRADPTIELVDVHRIDAALKPIILGSQPLNRQFVITALVGMAGTESRLYPIKDFIVEMKLAEHFGKLFLQSLLADISAAAGRRLAATLIGVAGTMIINIFLLLDFADYRTAAFAAGNQPGECKIMLNTTMLLALAAIEHLLHLLPKID